MLGLLTLRTRFGRHAAWPSKSGFVDCINENADVVDEINILARARCFSACREAAQPGYSVKQ